jgi:hypothetical protein
VPLRRHGPAIRIDLRAVIQTAYKELRIDRRTCLRSGSPQRATERAHARRASQAQDGMAMPGDELAWPSSPATRESVSASPPSTSFAASSRRSSRAAVFTHDVSGPHVPHIVGPDLAPVKW